MTKLERRIHIVEQERNEDTVLARLGSLVGHPLRAHGIARPDDDRTLCALERLLDHPVIAFPVRDIAIPPHVEALRFDRLYEGLDSLAIGTGIAHEDIAHALLDDRSTQRRFRRQ